MPALDGRSTVFDSRARGNHFTFKVSPMATVQPKIHEVKTWPDYFDATLEGRKLFEVRENDRGYLPGDTLFQREWDPYTEKYTGRECHHVIGFVLWKWPALRPGNVVLGLLPKQD